MKWLIPMLMLLAAACTSPAEREAMDFLTTHMPEGDRDTLSEAFLRENVRLALRAREEFPWTAALPDSIFLNEVLPYAVVDEPREAWRSLFYELFAPKVRDANDLREAIAAVNRDIHRTVGVEYDTRRARTNQSPSESMAQGMASCTGLSIILVDALRSVGIPARFAGTPNWHDDRGNHSWVEVWIDGAWHFTEFYPDAAGLDRSWFLADAAQGDPTDRTHSIWATSFKPTGDWFPMVWSEDSRQVHGINVTQNYIARYREVMDANVAAGTHVPVKFAMLRAAGSDERVAANVDVFAGDQQMGGGRTAGATQDLNDRLTFYLEKNKEYTFRYSGADGRPREVTAFVGIEPLEVVGYME